MHRRSFVAAAGICATFLPRMSWAFKYPMDEPALVTPLASRSPLLAVARAGNRWVAAGVRGHVVYSDDGGTTWRQAKVPVSVDLCGLSFPSERQGWAVGHAGVVLHSRDGGANWTRVLGGHDAFRLAVDYYQTRAAAGGEDAPLLKRAQAQLSGALQPFLDVYFQSDTRGIVVGTFNSIFSTEDGGASWTPLYHTVPNRDELNFYAVRGRGDRVFLAGEQGQVWRRLGNDRTFVAVPTPYKGTMFGLIVGDGGTVFAFGMRGAMYRSDDNGAKWSKVEIDTAAGITGGTLVNDGRIVVVDQAGSVHVSSDGGLSFVARRLSAPMPYYAVAGGPDDSLALAGAAGVMTTSLS
jgi:photosystem II stability/assembly factor-like uncharacterized protein